VLPDRFRPTAGDPKRWSEPAVAEELGDPLQQGLAANGGGGRGDGEALGELAVGGPFGDGAEQVAVFGGERPGGGAVGGAGLGIRASEHGVDGAKFGGEDDRGGQIGLVHGAGLGEVGQGLMGGVSPCRRAGVAKPDGVGDGVEEGAQAALGGVEGAVAKGQREDQPGVGGEVVGGGGIRAGCAGAVGQQAGEMPDQPGRAAGVQRGDLGIADRRGGAVPGFGLGGGVIDGLTVRALPGGGE
jgi:hypothetical protein